MSLKHFVTFYSPGTLFSESTTKQIESWDPSLAVKLADDVLERYDAKPYGFRFETRVVVPDVPDGQGGFLKVETRLVNESGTYFLGGKLETLDEVEGRNDPKESILRYNMRCDAGCIVCVNTNSFRHTQVFGENDFVIDAMGVIVERGNDPARIAYRAEVKSRAWAHYKAEAAKRASRRAAT